MRLYYSYWEKLSSDKIRARKISEKFVGRVVLTINRQQEAQEDDEGYVTLQDPLFKQLSEVRDDGDYVSTPKDEIGIDSGKAGLAAICAIIEDTN